MQERLINFISHDELQTKIIAAAQLLEKFPPSLTAEQWLSIINDTSPANFLSQLEMPCSPEQLELFQLFRNTIHQGMTIGATREEQAQAVIYKSVILINCILPESLAVYWVEAIQGKYVHLDLSEKSINDDQAIAISIILPCTNIESINLYNNNINGKGALALARCKLITSLNLGKNNISDDDIAKAFGENDTLRELNVDDSRFTLVGHTALANNTRLSSLSLRNGNVSPAAAEKLGKNSYFDILKLGNNDLGNEVNKLALTYTLRELDLSNNKIEDAGAIPFITNSSLTSLNLSHNLLSSACVAAFAANPRLTVDVGHNEDVTIDAIEAMYTKSPIESANLVVKAGIKNVQIPALTRLCLFAVQKMLETKNTGPNASSSVSSLPVPQELKDKLHQHKV